MTSNEEKLMRAIARDLTGPFWDPTQAEIALARIKEHFSATHRDVEHEASSIGALERAILRARGGPAPISMQGYA